MHECLFELLDRLPSAEHAFHMLSELRVPRQLEVTMAHVERHIGLAGVTRVQSTAEAHAGGGKNLLTTEAETQKTQVTRQRVGAGRAEVRQEVMCMCVQGTAGGIACTGRQQE